MTAVLPPRADERRARGGFVRLLRAEWTKFRTVRGWVIGMVVAAVVTVLIGLFGTAGPTLGHPPDAIPTGPDGQAVNDSFYFVHRTLQGDGSITVPVTSLTGIISMGPDERRGVEPWAKAGIIVKDGLRPGSHYAAIMVTGGHGVRMQHDYVHDTAAPDAVASARWLRLVRSGDTVTGFGSADGTHWTRVGSARLPGLASMAQVGPFVASPMDIKATAHGAAFDPAVATATFGTVALSGRWTPGAWKGEQVRGAGTSGSYTDTVHGGFTETGAGLTVTGAGDIAPVVGGPALGTGYTLENLLVGAFAGILVAAVIGALFLSAEHRRGLIRITFAASPRRGRVLAAKALVIGSVAFATGLAAAAVTVPLATARARGHGFFILPTPAWTEVRVVAGTALLFAVAAVFALAVAAVIRRGAAAVTIIVAVLVLPYVLATGGLLPDGPSAWLLRVTPAAGFAIQQTVVRYPQVDTLYTPSAGYFPLPSWAGFAVLCAYTAVALAAASHLLRRRDA
ncbi:ABC transporter permease subunit [Actinomadura opuntiae]|uniref:ABC transporter permease subunit n=1 Tax=Actinomadura sp. OS1-43 TaxID=604315 RepID=UPI00255AFE6C|nr:ABC transporter permease subunit [Actinomadura sp. OS1-43]MDL4817725.1 ABC transporter permease subunit [Actinomadura sp. OS1-43]